MNMPEAAGIFSNDLRLAVLKAIPYMASTLQKSNNEMPEPI
jgi:hypothetical protein